QSTKDNKWPLAISTLDETYMVVRFSTMPYSPLAVTPSTFGHRLPLTETAAGMTYLAFCSELEYAALMDLMGIQDRPRHNRDTVRAAVLETRKRGYGLRLAEGKSESSTLAVPLSVDGELYAVISMTTFA